MQYVNHQWVFIISFLPTVSQSKLCFTADSLDRLCPRRETQSGLKTTLRGEF